MNRLLVLLTAAACVPSSRFADRDPTLCLAPTTRCGLPVPCTVGERTYVEAALPGAVRMTVDVPQDGMWLDVDVFEQAGPDGTLLLPPLRAAGPGPHVLELFTDARAAAQVAIDLRLDPRDDTDSLEGACDPCY